MVACAPAFEDLARTLARRLDGRILAAHNARFDYGVLRHEFHRAGVEYESPVLCTVKLSRRLFPQHRRHNLDALLVRHALFCLDRHRALGDARMLWEIVQLWRHDPGEAAVQRACAELMRPPLLPPALASDTLDALPEGHGVYAFHDAHGAPLYVGRAANIRARVIAHFADSHRSARDADIAGAVARVECTPTTGAFGASLRELALVRTLRPLHNRRREGEGEPYSWRWSPAQPGQPPRLVAASALDLDAIDAHYGLYRSPAAARQALREIASAYALCHRLLGLEAAPERGACSAHAQGRCRGACVGAEHPLSHAMRLTQAFTRLRLRRWPYPGAIGIRERDQKAERSELHVFDRWRHLGTVHAPAELEALGPPGPRGGLDIDIYRLLARTFRALPPACQIVRLDARALC